MPLVCMAPNRNRGIGFECSNGGVDFVVFPEVQQVTGASDVHFHCSEPCVPAPKEFDAAWFRLTWLLTPDRV